MASCEESEIDHIDALTILAKMYLLNATQLPKDLHICVAGTTELAHPCVQEHFDKQMAASALAERMAWPSAKDAFFVVQLTQLMQRDDINRIWNHSLDGECLLQVYRKSRALGPLQNLSYSVLVILMLWMQNLKNMDDAYAIFMCSQGKHRSIYMAHLVCMVLRLVLAALHVDVHVHFKWFSGHRILEEIDTDCKLRQVGPVTRDILPGWLRYYGHDKHSCKLVCLDLTDGQYLRGFGQGAEADKFNLGLFFQNVEIFPIGKFFNLCGTQNHVQMLKVLLANSTNVLNSWHYFLWYGVSFPETCSVCEKGGWQWPYDPLFYFRALIQNISVEIVEARSVSSTTPEVQKRKRWADVTSDSDKEETLWPTRVPSTATIAAKGPGVPLRAVSGRPRPRAVVRFAEEPEIREVDSSYVIEFWQLGICVANKVLLFFDLNFLTDEEAEQGRLLRQAQSRKGPFYLLTDVRATTEAPKIYIHARDLVHENAVLQRELDCMWELLGASQIPIQRQEAKSKGKSFFSTLESFFSTSKLFFNPGNLFFNPAGLFFSLGKLFFRPCQTVFSPCLVLFSLEALRSPEV